MARLSRYFPTVIRVNIMLGGLKVKVHRILVDQVKVAVAQAKSDLVNSPDAVNQSGGGTDAD